MEEVGMVRIYLLRGMYFLIALGLGLSVIPHVVTASGNPVDLHTELIQF